MRKEGGPVAVHLHIERLVVDEQWLGQVPARRLGDAVAGELERELVERGIAARLGTSGSVDALAGPDLAIGRSPTADGLGRDLGRAIASSFETSPQAPGR
jgi:hypothetical protein